jgi:hypothetical protein
MTFKIYDIPREMVSDFWSAVESMLTKALEHHPHLDAPGVLRLLVANFAQLFVMTKGGNVVAACVMERTQYPSHVVANVVAFAGEYGVFREHGDEIQARLETWARDRGCDRIAFVGRPGWTRFFVNRAGGKSIPLVHAWKTL